jgi:glycerophosphoryl diester phosphodiesterase
MHPAFGIPLALLAFLLFGSTIAQPERSVLVQAHRGFSENYPENTLRAFEEAIQAGADRIETDLALTSDGVVVLMHDLTVDRTTNGEGGTSSFTLEELKQLDAGSWKGAEFAGEQVPTLAEALALADGRAELNLEIKARDRSRSATRAIIDAGVAEVLEHGALDRVVFSSFDYEALLEVRKLAPEARLLLLDWDAPSEFGWLDVAIAQEFYAWSPRAMYLTKERVEKAKEAGLHIHVGATSNPLMPLWLSWGVDGFSADDTAALVARLEQLGLR